MKDDDVCVQPRAMARPNMKTTTFEALLIANWEVVCIWIDSRHNHVSVLFGRI